MKNFKNLSLEFKWGLGIFSFYILWSLIWILYSCLYKGSIFTPYLPVNQIESELIFPLKGGFLAGSDIYGRSLLEVLSAGLVYSLGVSFLVSFLSCAIGIMIGHLSIVGTKGIGFLSDLSTNLIFIFPNILIAILFMSIAGQSYWGLIFCLTFTGWPAYAKISKGEIQRVFALSYVESSKAIGVNSFRLFFKVIIPEILPQLTIHFVLGLSGVIITEATLGFLGLGVSEFSWGVILSMAKTVLLEAPYIIIISGTLMAGIIIASNLLGDGLRDYLDVRK